MDPNDDLWTAIRRVLPDAEVLAAAVAAELGEPVDDVRASVLIGTIAMNGQLGPEAAAIAAIDAELARVGPATARRSRGRLANVETLPDLPEMTWVKVIGTANFPLEKGRRISVVTVEKVEKTEPPEESMLQ